MASVSSLDKDLRDLRMDKYTPARANEARQWIEGVLGEPLKSQDLLDALKDGTVLCRLVNLVLGPDSVRFKQSAMPFVQMENISHFLRACQAAPLSLQPHDCFLTVDLYERKDAAQVLQTIGAFSRRAAALQPSRFPSDIGGKRPSAMSPQASGSSSDGAAGHGRMPSNASSNAGSAYRSGSPTVGARPGIRHATASPPGASSWAKKSDMGAAVPAWNIAQYGWTGGASQGNQGVTFGGRRQLVSAQPAVPNLAEKERRRREQELEADRQRQIAEEEERKRRAQREEEERIAQAEEARRWQEETKRQRERERQEAEAEKRRWEEEEQRWKEEEEQRKKEEKDAEARLEQRGLRPRLQGQFLSSYQAEQRKKSRSPTPRVTSESERIKELERELEEARERERNYEKDRVKTGHQRTGSMQAAPTSSVEQPSPEQDQKLPVEDEWKDQQSERSFLRQQWARNQEPVPQSTRPLPVPAPQTDRQNSARPLPVPHAQTSMPSATHVGPPTTSSRPLPVPARTPSPPSQAPMSPRPLPNPSDSPAPQQPMNRTSAFLASNPAPRPLAPSRHTPSGAAFTSGAEQAAEDSRRLAAQHKTRAGGWASKSLLEREMELERERQREWEEAQQATKAAAARGEVDPSAGSGPGESWDVNTYGYTGGDNLNKGGGGVYAGRRQIIGPRAMGSKQG